MGKDRNSSKAVVAIVVGLGALMLVALLILVAGFVLFGARGIDEGPVEGPLVVEEVPVEVQE